MFIKLVDAIDTFLFGQTIVTEETLHHEPTKFKIIKPGQSLGLVVNDFSPPAA